MAAPRPPIPSDLEAELFAANRRTCCTCHEPRKHVQIHHIDGDRTNNDWDNLAVVCLDCHSRVTGDEGLGRRYKPEEVSLYKERWEEECAGGDLDEDDDDNAGDDLEGDEDEEDDDEPVFTKESEFIVRAPGHQPLHLEMQKGDVLTATVTSDVPVDVWVAPRRVYGRWDDDEEIDSPDVLDEDHLRADITFTAPRDGTFVLVIENTDEETEATASLDVSIWRSDDESE
jgi:hypothetical protein